MPKSIVSPIFCLLASTLLSACVIFLPQYRVIGDVKTVSALKELHVVHDKIARHTEPVNTQVLRETGLSMGMQLGLALRANEINQMRAGSAKALDKQFDFNALLLSHHVLPPVIVQAERSVNLADAQTLRLADRTYQIVKQAEFVSVAPTWRNYLPMYYDIPEIPPTTCLPTKNKKEQAIWKRAVEQGYQLGRKQADSIDQANCAGLVREFYGMVLYRKLLKQGLVSEPEVARSRLGITGDDNVLRLDDQVVRLTGLPKLESDSQKWKPIIVQHDGAN